MGMTNENNPLQFEKIVQKIAPNSRLLRTWPLSGGISAEMTALEIEHPDGRKLKWIVRCPGVGTQKQNLQAAQTEFRLLQMTQILGLPTPRPVTLDLSGELFTVPYLVVEYIEGRPEFKPANLPGFILQAACHLARIHRADCSQLDLSFLPKRTEGFTGLAGGSPLPVDSTFEVERIQAILGPVWPIPQRNASVLLHGDYWPGNLLWQAGRLAAVVDWEDARLGDPLLDLAISRLDLLWIFGREAMQSFTRQYLSWNPIDITCQPYWDLWAALRLARLAGPDLAGWAAYFHPYGRQDIIAQSILDHSQFFIAQAFDKLVSVQKTKSPNHNDETGGG